MGSSVTSSASRDTYLSGGYYCYRSYGSDEKEGTLTSSGAIGSSCFSGNSTETEHCTKQAWGFFSGNSLLFSKDVASAIVGSMRLSLVVVSIHCYWYISHVFLGIRAHRRKQKVIIRGGYSYSAYVTNCCHGWFVNSFLSSLAVRDGCKAI